MKHASWTSLTLAAVCLAACVSAGDAPVETRAPQAAAVSALGDDPVLSRLSVLSGQELNVGECGLFLWLKRDDAPLIFFQSGHSAAASMQVDGAAKELERMSASDQVMMGFFEKQTFTSGDLTVSVLIEPESTRSIGQGLKVPSGLVSLTDTAGWSATLPVAGIIGCK